jgi:hypothetical protein
MKMKLYLIIAPDPETRRRTESRERRKENNKQAESIRFSVVKG